MGFVSFTGVDKNSWIIMQMRANQFNYKRLFCDNKVVQVLSDTLTCGAKAYFCTCHEGRNTKNNEEAN